jgi:hypothetical protein
MKCTTCPATLYVLLCAAPLAAQSFGTSCGGANGQPAVISVSPAMRPGLVSRVEITNLPPNSAALLMIGTSWTQWAGVPLPLGLAGIGMPGCDIATAPDVILPFPTVSGTAAANFVVPNHSSLSAQWLYLQTLFAQPGLNPAHTGISRPYAARVAPTQTPTTYVSSITQWGITFQFAQPVQAGQFVNGDWFVVGPATLVDMSPPCVTVGGRVMNGAMINPDASSSHHGYDKALFGPGNEMLYVDALNVSLNLSSANPRYLTPGQSLIKVVSNTNTNLIPHIDTCAILTVLSSAPPVGSFRPPYAGTDHEVRYDEQMLDWSLLQNLTPAANMPNVAAETAKFERPWLDHVPGWPSRYLHPVQNMPDYGRDLAALYNQAVLLCHVGIPLAQKRTLVNRLVQIGIDFHGNVRDGCFWEGVGGHGTGRKWPILFAGALLHDADMLAVGQNYPSVRNLNGTFTVHFGEDAQTFYVQQTSSSQINWGFGGYASNDLGLPEFGFSHVHEPSSDTVSWTGNSYRRCCTANAWIGAVLGARMMGLVEEWNHPPLFDYTDRYALTEPSGWTRSWSGWVERMWDLYRPTL